MRSFAVYNTKTAYRLQSGPKVYSICKLSFVSTLRWNRNPKLLSQKQNSPFPPRALPQCWTQQLSLCQYGVEQHWKWGAAKITDISRSCPTLLALIVEKLVWLTIFCAYMLHCPHWPQLYFSYRTIKEWKEWTKRSVGYHLTSWVLPR